MGTTQQDKGLPVREEMAKHRTALTRAVVRAEQVISHPAFFLLLVLVHLAWIVLNTGWLPGFEPWDPYPFTFLATVASIEAPLITLLVLMRQHRDRRIGEVRDEVSLEIAVRTQHQAALLARLLDQVCDRVGVDAAEQEEALGEMKRSVDPGTLLDRTLQRLEIVEGKNPEEE